MLGLSRAVRVWKPRRGAPLVALVLAACAQSQAGSEPLPEAPSAEAYAETAASAMCDRDRRCCEAVDGRFDHSACVMASVGLGWFQGPGERYQPEHAQKCLHALASEVCNIPRFTGGVVDKSDCARVFAPGETPLGGRCQESFDCAPSETDGYIGCAYHDYDDDGTIRTCQTYAVVSEGEACWDDDPLVARDCERGLYCTDDGFCARPGELGEACTQSPQGHDCAAGLVCDGALNATGRCVEPRPPGAVCEPGMPQCLETLCPWEGRCRPYPDGVGIQFCQLPAPWG